jgi:hypothetical protein
MGNRFSGQRGSFGTRTSGGADAMPRQPFGRIASSHDTVRRAAPSPQAAGKVGALLAQFPGPVTLHRSRLKFTAVLVGSLAFVVLGIFMLQDDSFTTLGLVKVWLCIGFFGFCSLAAAVMLLPGAGSLTLDADGVTWVSFYRQSHLPWERIGNFAVGQYTPPRGPTLRFVGFDDAGRPADNMTSRRIGYNSEMPDTYGLSHEQLASLLNQWRARAMGHSR